MGYVERVITNKPLASILLLGIVVEGSIVNSKKGLICMAYGKTASEGTKDSGLEQVLIWLREDLVGELEAINQYQAHIDKIDNEEVRELLEHIRDDEKEHVAEITHLLARIDMIQREKFAEDHTMAPEQRVVNEGAKEVDEKVATVGNMFGHK